MFSTSRRSFIRGLAGITALTAAGGCFSVGRAGSGKIRLAAVGLMGKGFTDWYPMIKSGKAELVAMCDADRQMLKSAQDQLNAKKYALDLSKIPFYTDYRELLDNCGILGVEAMTISTPDHVHAPVAIGAMQQGIHVFVQKPLVRTLWELDYFNKTARDNDVIVQMGNQGSSLDSMRRCTEVLRSGILGEVKEVYVWTNRPVWPQGIGVANYIKSRGNTSDAVRPGLDWNAWLATAKDRPFLDRYPDGIDVYDPWGLGKNVYHTFTWRGFFDFGAGAFGDMACHTMNLAFRGLELDGVSDAECYLIESSNDIAYPLKSRVRLTYKARPSKARPGVTLPAVTLHWLDGNEKPSAEIMPKYAATHNGHVPNTGCYIIGDKGAVLMCDDYGERCEIAMNEDKEFKNIFQHEAAIAVEHTIPFRSDSASSGGQSNVAMSGFAEGHYGEFIDAIRGEGPIYKETHSRCFSDIEYCIPQMEGILVGCMAQRVPGVKLQWNSKMQTFDNDTANSYIKPYIRRGYSF